MVRKFKALGWTGPNQGSKHQFMLNGTRPQRIPNGNCDVGLLSDIIKQAGISRDEWMEA